LKRIIILTILYWVFKFEHLNFEYKNNKTCFWIRTIQFWIVNLKSPKHPLKLTKSPNLYYPQIKMLAVPPRKCPLLPPKDHSWKNWEQILIRNRSKQKTKKVCNLYPFSWRNLCFTFESFLLGVNVERKKNHTLWSAKPKLQPILLMETSMITMTSLFIINDFHFLLYFQG